MSDKRIKQIIKDRHSVYDNEALQKTEQDEIEEARRKSLADLLRPQVRKMMNSSTFSSATCSGSANPSGSFTLPSLFGIQRPNTSQLASQLFSVETLEPGAQASYPLADDFEVPVFVSPNTSGKPKDWINLEEE